LEQPQVFCKQTKPAGVCPLPAFFVRAGNKEQITGNREQCRPLQGTGTHTPTEVLRSRPHIGPLHGTGTHTHNVQRGVSTMPRKRLPRKRIPPAFEHTLRSNVVNNYLTRTAMSVLRTSGRYAFPLPGPPNIVLVRPRRPNWGLYGDVCHRTPGTYLSASPKTQLGPIWD
jgi:hypothetical protein